MINVIKMEFYLTIKNRIWWILALVAACFTIFFTAMINYSSDAMISSPDDLDITEISAAEVIEKDLSLAGYCEKIICSDIVLMFVTIFASLLALQEYNNGFVKNIWVHLEKKWHLFIAKILVLMSYVLFLFFLNIMVLNICNILFLKAEKMGITKRFLKIMAIQYFFEVVFGIIIITFALFLKKIIPTLVTGIIYVAFGHSLLCGVLDLIIDKIFKLDKAFKIENYTIYGNILRITSYAEREAIIQAVIVTIVFAGISSIICNLCLEKRNVL